MSKNSRGRHSAPDSAPELSKWLKEVAEVIRGSALANAAPDDHDGYVGTNDEILDAAGTTRGAQERGFQRVLTKQERSTIRAYLVD